MKKSLIASAVLAALAVNGMAYGQAAEANDPNTGAFSFDGGVDFTTAYFFRGYNQQDTGLIVQPYGNVRFNLVDTDDFDINGYVGTWNSFHSEQEPGDKLWYESDIYAGADLVFGSFTVGAVYTYYEYPGNAFNSVQEVGFRLGYDDAAAWGSVAEGFKLNPYVLVAFEFDDGNGEEDTYAEVGVSPGYTLALKDQGFLGDVALTFPIKLGMSIEDYYTDEEGDNEIFGYGSIGITGAVPLPVPARYGAVNLVAGVEYIQLFADSAENANDGGENYEVIGKVGVTFAY